MASIKEALMAITQAFALKGEADPRRQAEDVLSSILYCNRSFLYAHGEQALTEETWKLCQDYLARRLKDEPLAYIHQEIEFYHCSIHVTPAVLIPRPETEILVDKIVQKLSKQSLKGKILWDLCTGSGCIGIALKKRFPALSVTLADLSSDALKLAAQNAIDNQVEVELAQGDLLEPFKGLKAHFCVCNPPYLSRHEYEHLELDVKAFEPQLALVGGETGLEFYERLARGLPSHLYPQAQVWLELGYQQGAAIQQLFRTPPWKAQHLENDWAGHNRFFFLENE